MPWCGVRRPSVRPSVRRPQFQNATPPKQLNEFHSYWTTIFPRMGEVKVVLQVALSATMVVPPMIVKNSKNATPPANYMRS